MENKNKKSDVPAIVAMSSLFLVPTVVGGFGGFLSSRTVLSSELLDPIDSMDPFIILLATVLGAVLANKGVEKIIERF